MSILKNEKKGRIIIPEIPKGYKSHPFSIDDEFAMPENLLNILENNGFDYKEYKGTFIIPPQAYIKHIFSKRYVPWQALLFNDNVVIYAKDSLLLDESGTTNKLHADNLLYLKLNHCLLYGKLDIVCSNCKEINQIEVEYNTTAHKILEPQLKRFLEASWDESKPLNRSKDIYERLKNIPIKYRNGVYIYVLQKNEILLDFLYLPRLVRKIGFIKINLTPNILFAITDKQLVILQDDLSMTSSYTWLLTYIPINNVKDFSFEKQRRLAKVIIKIKRDNMFKELSFEINDKFIDDIKKTLSAVIR